MFRLFKVLFRKWLYLLKTRYKNSRFDLLLMLQTNNRLVKFSLVTDKAVCESCGCGWTLHTTLWELAVAAIKHTVSLPECKFCINKIFTNWFWISSSSAGGVSLPEQSTGGLNPIMEACQLPKTVESAQIVTRMKGQPCNSSINTQPNQPFKYITGVDFYF